MEKHGASLPESAPIDGCEKQVTTIDKCGQLSSRIFREATLWNVGHGILQTISPQKSTIKRRLSCCHRHDVKVNHKSLMCFPNPDRLMSFSIPGEALMNTPPHSFRMPREWNWKDFQKGMQHLKKGVDTASASSKSSISNSGLAEEVKAPTHAVPILNIPEKTPAVSLMDTHRQKFPEISKLGAKPGKTIPEYLGTVKDAIDEDIFSDYRIITRVSGARDSDKPMDPNELPCGSILVQSFEHEDAFVTADYLVLNRDTGVYALLRRLNKAEYFQSKEATEAFAKSISWLTKPENLQKTLNGRRKKSLAAEFEFAPLVRIYSTKTHVQLVYHMGDELRSTESSSEVSDDSDRWKRFGDDNPHSSLIVPLSQMPYDTLDAKVRELKAQKMCAGYLAHLCQTCHFKVRRNPYRAHGVPECALDTTILPVIQWGLDDMYYVHNHNDDSEKAVVLFPGTASFRQEFVNPVRHIDRVLNSLLGALYPELEKSSALALTMTSEGKEFVGKVQGAIDAAQVRSRFGVQRKPQILRSPAVILEDTQSEEDTKNVYDTQVRTRVDEYLNTTWVLRLRKHQVPIVQRKPEKKPEKVAIPSTQMIFAPPTATPLAKKAK